MSFIRMFNDLISIFHLNVCLNGLNMLVGEKWPVITAETNVKVVPAKEMNLLWGIETLYSGEWNLLTLVMQRKYEF